MCDVAERLKNIGRQEGFQAGRSEERINAVKFAISLGASEEKILKQAVFQRGIRKSFGSYESLIVEIKIAVLKTYSSIRAWVLYG